MMLGWDVNPAALREAARVPGGAAARRACPSRSGSSSPACARACSRFVDVEQLFTHTRRVEEGGTLGPSNNARMRTYLRRMHSKGAGIAQDFLDMLQAAPAPLRHRDARLHRGHRARDAAHVRLAARSDAPPAAGDGGAAALDRARQLGHRAERGRGAARRADAHRCDARRDLERSRRHGARGALPRVSGRGDGALRRDHDARSRALAGRGGGRGSVAVAAGRGARGARDRAGIGVRARRRLAACGRSLEARDRAVGARAAAVRAEEAGDASLGAGRQSLDRSLALRRQAGAGRGARRRRICRPRCAA